MLYTLYMHHGARMLALVSLALASTCDGLRAAERVVVLAPGGTAIVHLAGDCATAPAVSCDGGLSVVLPGDGAELPAGGLTVRAPIRPAPGMYECRIETDEGDLAFGVRVTI